MRFRFIDAERANYPVKVLCRVLMVSTSGFYAWLGRPPSARVEQRARLRATIELVFEASRRTYGSPRVHADLAGMGLQVSKSRVEREMRALGLVARRPKKFRVTTDSDHKKPVAENVLDRDFHPAGPNHSWASDITCVWTREGWLYLAVVIDLFSRRVVGWSTASHMRTSLVLSALRTAIGRRLPAAGLVHHSDRGSQYASKDYREELEKHRLTCSMSRRADCWDNAVAESFFSTIKHELLHRNDWLTRAAATLSIADYIECFYNVRRRHSYLGFRSPAEYERIHTIRYSAA